MKVDHTRSTSEWSGWLERPLSAWLLYFQKHRVPFGVGTMMAISIPFITVSMSVASFSYFLMVLGVHVRRALPRVHILFMGLAVTIDLLLVLTLEYERHAVDTALSFRLNSVQQSHIIVSSIAVILYVPIVTLGVWKLWRTDGHIKILRWHKSVGICAFLFRTLGYFLMFSMLTPH